MASSLRMESRIILAPHMKNDKLLGCFIGWFSDHAGKDRNDRIGTPGCILVQCNSEWCELQECDVQRVSQDNSFRKDIQLEERCVEIMTKFRPFCCRA